MLDYKQFIILISDFKFRTLQVNACKFNTYLWFLIFLVSKLLQIPGWCKLSRIHLTSYLEAKLISVMVNLRNEGKFLHLLMKITDLNISNWWNFLFIHCPYVLSPGFSNHTSFCSYMWAKHRSWKKKTMCSRPPHFGAIHVVYFRRFSQKCRLLVFLSHFN